MILPISLTLNIFLIFGVIILEQELRLQDAIYRLEKENQKFSEGSENSVRD
ncbi:hypothetical protein [Clostridium niameyense]|uniref:hypothetical protein n=1 Tax=Clostridium niameyense TaxID=1622073 RepID=UPI0013D02B59|nr:hypothetical protein [Clostridium niameyense]